MLQTQINVAEYEVSMRNLGVYIYVKNRQAGEIPVKQQRSKLAAISEILGRLNKEIKQAKFPAGEMPQDVHQLRMQLRQAARTLNRLVAPAKVVMPYAGAW